MNTYNLEKTQELLSLEKFAEKIDNSMLYLYKDIQDSKGRNLVFFVSADKLVDLLSNDFDINHIDKDGRNALFEADLKK